MRTRFVGVVVVVALAACSSEAKPTKPAPTPTQPATPTPAPTTPADACADIRARFDHVLATKTDACTTAADCGCFNPVAGRHLGCGGVTDAATVAKLAPIEAEFHAAKCAWTHQCGPWACEPKCEQGRCSR